MESPSSKHVLILYSYGHGGKGLAIFDEGFLSVMSAARVTVNDLYFEYLDLQRNEGDKEYPAQVLELLQRKYGHRKIDLIITVQQPALRFLLSMGGELAPGAPVITLQSPMPTEAEAGGRRFLSQLTQFDIKGTLARALELFPKTKRVVFVSGSSDADKAMADVAAKIVSPLKGRLECEYTSELSINEMLQRVSHLPPNTVIIFTQYNRDTSGRVTLAYEVEEMITKVANAPVFGLYDFNVRNGGIGGSLVSVEELGKATGRLALGILNGSLHLTQPVASVNNPVVPLFDWAQVVRWGGDTSLLPPETRFINRPSSLWEQSRAIVVLTTIALLLQSLMIAALLVQKRRRHFAEEALRESEEKFRMLAESAPQLVWICQPDGWNIFFNQRWVDYTGLSLEESSGHGWIRPFHPDDKPRAASAWKQATETGGKYDLECRLRRVDGVYRWWLIRGAPLRRENGEIVRWFGTCTDIDEIKQAEAEREKLQSQRTQSQKMESIGQLAGGIAHDFNNILAGTILHLDSLAAARSLDAELRAELQDSIQNLKRGATLTRQLLVFSRQAEVDMQPVDLNKVFSDLLSMLRRMIPENVSVNLLKQQTSLWVSADPGMMEQVLLNLSINARDAMPSGGTIEIRTSTVAFGESDLRANPSRRAGRFAAVYVRDSGCGMNKDTLNRIFDPFFTTKQVGRGTGLGLSTVYGIVSKHSGWLEVESEVGVGSQFAVMLPLVEASSPQEQGPDDESCQGKETILLVEDDARLRSMLCTFLQGLGYTVIEACGVQEGVALWKQHQASVDLLFTDMVMPGTLSGYQMAVELRLSRPGLPVVIFTGYSKGISEINPDQLDTITVLNKPSEPALIAKTIRRALSQSLSK